MALQRKHLFRFTFWLLNMRLTREARNLLLQTWANSRLRDAPCVACRKCRSAAIAPAPTEKHVGEAAAACEIIQIPWAKPPSKRRREIIVPESKSTADARPIRADARARLVAAIARGRRWLDELARGDVSDIETIAARERCGVRKVNMTVSLAFLAPDLVKAAIEGRLQAVPAAFVTMSCPNWSSFISVQMSLRHRGAMFAELILCMSDGS
jgi:hypothetical protein